MDNLVSEARQLVESSSVDLNPQAETYYNALEKAGQQHGNQGVEAQIRYLASNIEVVDAESRALRNNLFELLGEGETHTDDTLSESEFETISQGFERYTEDKVDKGESVSLDDFEQYAATTSYPVEHVLAANPWVRTVLTEEALNAYREAQETVDIGF